MYSKIPVCPSECAFGHYCPKMQCTMETTTGSYSQLKQMNEIVGVSMMAPGPMEYIEKLSLHHVFKFEVGPVRKSQFGWHPLVFPFNWLLYKWQRTFISNILLILVCSTVYIVPYWHNVIYWHEIPPLCPSHQIKPLIKSHVTLLLLTMDRTFLVLRPPNQEKTKEQEFIITELL